VSKTKAIAEHPLRLFVALLIAGALLAPVLARGATGGATEPGSLPAPTPAEPAGEGPYDRQGMWIWYIDKSEGGAIGRIIARARRAGVGTVYVKAGDGSDVWSQFTKYLVGRLHAGGLDVCAWQFVYGDNPLAEARVAAAAVQKGADCFVIDAEGDYEGKYASADRYIRTLRARIGAGFPVSLAGFPYVDYHPSFPYSVFLGPGGAQYNQPQMYWKAIGTTVRTVFEHTNLFNRVYGAPIYPVGQTYEGPGRRDLLRFRRFATSYGNLAPSWWSWQETDDSEWAALGAATAGPVVGYRPVTKQPTLRSGSKGDLVVWAQEHLVSAGKVKLPVTGIFGRLTRSAVRSFQSDRGLTADGVIGTTTWRALLRYAPVRVSWAARTRSARRADGRSASRTGLSASAPLSAALPARAYEIDPGPRP